MGPAEALSSRLRGRTSRAALYDRGKLIVQVALMLAGDGASCADIEHLRCEDDLFGDVTSDSTVHRALHEITPELRSELAEAVFEVRQKIWERSAQTKGAGPVYIDIDASIVDLVRWFQLLCFEGYWQGARLKALRWGIFHAPGRFVSSTRRRIVRILEGWPTAKDLLAAYRRIELIT
jgi:hypothetical protein